MKETKTIFNGREVSLKQVDRDKLKAIISLLEIELEGRSTKTWMSFTIEMTYEDYGAGMMWENIICHFGESGCSKFQVLNGSQIERLEFGRMDAIVDIVKEVLRDCDKLLGI